MIPRHDDRRKRDDFDPSALFFEMKKMNINARVVSFLLQNSKPNSIPGIRIPFR